MVVVVLVEDFFDRGGVVVVVVAWSWRYRAMSSGSQLPTHTLRSMAANWKATWLWSVPIATTLARVVSQSRPPSACRAAASPMSATGRVRPPAIVSAPESVMTTTWPYQIARWVTFESARTE